MTVYGRSDIDAVTISGADHVHVREKNELNMIVTCAFCEPELIEMGWVTDPRNIPLTFDEKLDAESAQQEIARFEQLKVAEAAREASQAVRTAGKAVRQKRNGTTR